MGKNVEKQEEMKEVDLDAFYLIFPLSLVFTFESKSNEHILGAVLKEKEGYATQTEGKKID